MNVLLDNKELIVAIGENIVFGTFEDEEKWKLSEYIYILDNDFTCIEVEDIPSYVEPYKYCYNEIDGFYINPNWVEPPKSIEQQIQELTLRIAESEFETDERLSKIELGLI